MINKLSSKFKLVSLVSLVLALVILVQLLVPAAGADGSANSPTEGASKKPSLFSATTRAEITGFKINNSETNTTFMTSVYGNTTNITANIIFRVEQSVNARGSRIILQLPDVVPTAVPAGVTPQYYDLSKISVQLASIEALKNYIDFESMSVEKIDGKDAIIFPFWSDRDISNIAISNLYVDIPFNQDMFGYVPKGADLGDFSVYSQKIGNGPVSTIKITATNNVSKSIATPFSNDTGDVIDGREVIYTDKRSLARFAFYNTATNAWFYHSDPVKGMIKLTMTLPKGINYQSSLLAFEVDKTDTKVDKISFYLDGNDIFNLKPDTAPIYPWNTGGVNGAGNQHIYFDIPKDKVDEITGGTNKFDINVNVSYYLFGDDTEKTLNLTSPMIVVTPDGVEKGKMNEDEISVASYQQTSLSTLYVSKDTNDNNKLGGSAAYAAHSTVATTMKNIGTGPLKSFSYEWTNDHPEGGTVLGLSSFLGTPNIHIQMYNVAGEIVYDKKFTHTASSNFWYTSKNNVKRVVVTALDDANNPIGLPAGQQVALSIWTGSNPGSKTDGSSDYEVKFKGTWEEYDEATSTFVEKTKTHSKPNYVKHVPTAVSFKPAIVHSNGNSPGETMSLTFHSNFLTAGSTFGQYMTPVSYIILPEGLEWIPGQTAELTHTTLGTVLGTIDDSTIEKLPQQINGKDVYKITPKMNTLSFITLGGPSLPQRFSLDFKIKASQKPGTLVLSDFYIATGEDELSKAPLHNLLSDDIIRGYITTPHVFDNRVEKLDGMDLEYLFRASPLNININATSLLLATADLKAGPLAPWEQNGPGKESIVNVDGTGDFRLVIENNGNVPVTEFTLYDILPNLATNTDTGNKPLASEWIASVENITIEAYDGNGVSRAFNGKIQYATTTDPKIDAYGSFAGRTGTTPTWIDYTAAAKGDVKSFRFLMNSGEVISGGEKIVINIKLRSPATATIADIDKKAYNSFVSLAKYEDGTKVAIGPDNQTLKLADTGTAIIKGLVFKARHGESISNFLLENAKVELFLATDLDTVIDSVMATDGSYKFESLPAADFIVKITPPADLSPNIYLMTKGATSVFNPNFQTDVIKLPANDTAPNQNAGFYRVGSVTPSYVYGGVSLKKGTTITVPLPPGSNTSGSSEPIKSEVPSGYLLVSEDSKPFVVDWDNPNLIVDFELKLAANDVKFMVKNTANTAYEELSGSPVSVENGVAIGAKILTNTSKVAGYKHIGWSTAQNATTPNFTSATVISDDIIVYEVLEAIEYTLTYVTNGGTPTPPVSQVKFGNIITKPATNPTKTGYTFSKWTTDSEGITEWIFTTGKMPASNLTLFAQWTASDNTVTFDTQDGSAVADQTVKTNALVSKPANPTKTGYTFSKWTTAAGGATEWIFANDKMPPEDLTLYAQWTANDNTVTFNSQDGSAVADQSVKTNALVTKPANPTKAGYAFTKWTTDIAGVTEWIFTTGKMPATNLTLYAQWTANDNTVIFDTQGGSTIANLTVKTDALVTKPANPTKAGYAFAKWTTDTGGATEWIFANDKMPPEDLTLYAQWTANDNTVTFDTQDGSAVAPQNVKTNALVTKPANPTKAGYTFTKWTTDIAGVTEWNFTTGKMPAANLTLYAQWTASDNIVTFNSQDGSAVADQTVKTNALVSKPANPTKTGYTFTKWTTTAGGATEWIFTTGKMPATNLTLYAQWTANDNIVTFDTQGGSTIANLTVKTNALVTKPANPTKAGYTFNKWTTDIAGVTEWNFATGKMPAANLTLYAQWTASDNIVTFNSQDGSAVADQTVKTNALVTKPANPTKAGYAFSKWTTDIAGVTEWIFTTGKMPATNLTLYAQWSLNSYKVDFNSQGGSDVTSIPKVDFGTKITKPANPTMDGFSFKEWSTDALGNTPWNFTLGTMPDNDLVLYAQWSANDNLVTFDTKGGSAIDPQNVKTNAFVTKPAANPTKTGYTFKNFTSDEAGITAWNFASDKVPANDITIYAQWTVNKYTLAYNAKGGAPTPSGGQTDFGTTIVLPTEPTRSGYAFSKWTSDEAGTKEWNFTTGKMPAANLTLYAQWSADDNIVKFDTQGGSTIADQSVKTDALVIKPATNPTKEGHTFKNFTSDKAGISVWNFASDKVPAGGTTIYAQWSVNKYTLAYDAKGGTPAPTGGQTDFGTIITKPNALTKEGYTFTNWTSDEAGAIEWNFTLGTMPAANLTLYAQWSLNSHKVDFDTQGGSAVTSIANAPFNSIIAKPADPTMDGFRFKEWTDSPTGGTVWNFTTSKMPDNDLVLYAQWNANDNKVTFDTKGGSTIAPQNVKTNDLSTKPATNPTKVGHTFVEWTSDSAGATPWSFSTKITNDITIYAKWSVNKYALAFDAKGGAPAPATAQIDFGAKITKPTDPTKSGYTFSGWTSDDAGTKVWNFTLGTMPDTALTLYAQWKVNSYKLTFDALGGEPAKQEVSLNFNAVINAPKEAPTRNLFAFGGWYYDKAFTQKLVFATDKMPNKDVIVYAKWDRTHFEVILELNGGTIAASRAASNQIKFPVLIGDTADISVYQPKGSKAATKASNVLLGYKDKAGVYSPNTFIMPSSDVVLTAQWQSIDSILASIPEFNSENIVGYLGELTKEEIDIKLSSKKASYTDGLGNIHTLDVTSSWNNAILERGGVSEVKLSVKDSNGKNISSKDNSYLYLLKRGYINGKPTVYFNQFQGASSTGSEWATTAYYEIPDFSTKTIAVVKLSTTFLPGGFTTEEAGTYGVEFIARYTDYFGEVIELSHNAKAYVKGFSGTENDRGTFLPKDDESSGDGSSDVGVAGAFEDGGKTSTTDKSKLPTDKNKDKNPSTGGGDITHRVDYTSSFILLALLSSLFLLFAKRSKERF